MESSAGSTGGGTTARDFFTVAGVVVGTTGTAGAITGGTLAAIEAPAAISLAVSAGGDAAVIGTAAAVSDIAGGAIVGATLGAAAGVVVVAVGGAGYGFGTMIYPWVDRNLIGPLYGF